jgi:Zn-dependent protease
MVTSSGSFRLFRFAGIDVFVHWSWFVVAVFEINFRRNQYSLPAWNAAEYIALFAIVLLHEFGHALACRQVGGQANRIILWPLGGVAFVSPPQRPGATLWAIAAGPLVNVVLAPLAFLLAAAAQGFGLGDALPDAQRFLWTMVYINVGLLVFNLLPIYPLDGGQILRSLLWFIFGRARSLTIASTIGFVGAAGLIAFAVVMRSPWMGLLAFFMLMTCWKSWRHAGLLSRMEALPRRPEFACPVCRAAPPIGAFWVCHVCRTQLDSFAAGGICPKCHTHFNVTACPNCGAIRPMTEWMHPPPVP